MDHQNYKHVIPIQLRFSDIDRLNHVNNACYLNFFELGRVQYFNHVFGPAINWNEKGFVLARTEIDHIQPLFLTDEVYCYTCVEKLGNKSLTVRNTLIKKTGSGDLECAKGLGVLVAMDYINNQSIEIPGMWRKLIRDFEGTSLQP